MSNVLSERLLQVETDFIVDREVNPQELLELLKFYGCVNIEEGERTCYGNMMDYFWKSFTIVEEAETDSSLDTYWRVYKHLPTDTYFKQSCYFDSYDYEPNFDNSYWNIVKPHQVTVTQYMDV